MKQKRYFLFPRDLFHGHVSRGETFLVSETFSLFFGDFDEKRRAGFS